MLSSGGRPVFWACVENSADARTSQWLQGHRTPTGLIGRSMLDCMEIRAIAAKREIPVYAIKGNWHQQNHGYGILNGR